MSGRRLLGWGGAAILIVGALVWAAWPSGGTETAADRAHELATEIRCPDCEALSVADSSSSSAQAIRADLGRSVYVARYGVSILLKPQSSGLGIVVWGLPVLAFALGAAGLALALARWRRQPRLHATNADEELVDGVRSG